MSRGCNSNQLNIAMLGHKRIPSREGGIEIVVSELAVRMAARGHQVTCYNRGGHHVSGASYDEHIGSNYQGVRLKKLWTIDGKGLAAASSSIFGAIAAAFGPYDVVHFHAEGPCIACGIPKLFGKRVIATIHGLDHRRAKWGHFASSYIMKGEKAAVRHADQIIVLSKSVQDYFRDTYGRETVLIPNGVNRPEVIEANVINSKYSLNKDDYILYLGRLVPEKGVHYLVEAYSRLCSENPSLVNKRLVIAGGSSDSSEYMDSLKNQVPDDLRDRVIFTGFIQGRELEELYSNAYIYVLPSDLEGMPLSLLEALSYGNCCLTSDIPECTDVIGDYGLSFRAGDVSSLTETLKRLIKDSEEVASYKSKAADYICGRYNWDQIVDRTLEIYRGNEE